MSHRDRDPDINELECPCCSDVGATADPFGFFYDGQPLECGCDGHVSCDSENPPTINAYDCECGS